MVRSKNVAKGCGKRHKNNVNMLWEIDKLIATSNVNCKIIVAATCFSEKIVSSSVASSTSPPAVTQKEVWCLDCAATSPHLLSLGGHKIVAKSPGTL